MSNLPEMQRVDSKMLESVGYDDSSEILYIRLQAGKTYAYHEVARSVYNDLMDASSKGRYFISQIRGAFPYERL